MKESRKLGLRKCLMSSFLIGSILLGLVLVGGSIYVAIKIFLTFKEHGIFEYGYILIILTGIGMGVFIPLFIVPFARTAMNAIKTEEKILQTEGLDGLRDFRESNEMLYPKKFGFNRNNNA